MIFLFNSNRTHDILTDKHTLLALLVPSVIETNALFKLKSHIGLEIISKIVSRRQYLRFIHRSTHYLFE